MYAFYCKYFTLYNIMFTLVLSQSTCIVYLSIDYLLSRNLLIGP